MVFKSIHNCITNPSLFLQILVVPMLKLYRIRPPQLKNVLGILKKKTKQCNVVVVLSSHLHNQDRSPPSQCCLGRRRLSSDNTLPPHTRVVICGGGVVANSVAYHLVQNGWKDIVVLEQGR